MDSQRRWIAYDTFKLIVGLLLLLLLLVLTLTKPVVTPAISASPESAVGVAAASQTPPVPTKPVALPTATLAVQASLTPTIVLPSATLPPTPTPSPTQAPPTPTTAAAAQPAPTETSQPTPTETPQPASTEAPSSQTVSGDCPLAQPSRLAVGKQAVVVANLNLRQDAGIDKPIIRVGLYNSKVEIIGGPVCTPYQNGAYLWWNVKTTDGVTGWSAEASLSKNFYFLQPVP